jgi:predicted alpha/beta superfamily hydrolase
MIDSRFRTWYFREATGIAGSSMGGIMAMHGAITYNQYFSKAACLSPGMYYNLSHFRRDLQKAALWNDTKIYIGWGEYEAGKAPRGGNPALDTREARSARRFASELKEKGIDAAVYFQAGGRHTEADWARQVPLFMQYLWF